MWYDVFPLLNESEHGLDLSTNDGINLVCASDHGLGYLVTSFLLLSAFLKAIDRNLTISSGRSSDVATSNLLLCL